MKSKVIEVFGVAGSGKTTFAENHENYDTISFSLLLKVIIFLWAVFEEQKLILKTAKVMKSSKSIRHLCFVLYKLKMVYVFKKYKNGSYIYDQGPIYNLAMIQKRINSNQLERLKNELMNITNRIRDNLDDSIYLVCDIETAMERVNNREKDHIYKKMSRELVYNDLKRWEKAYEKIAQQLSSQRIDSGSDISLKDGKEQ